jgi:hypothetical protein
VYDKFPVMNLKSLALGLFLVSLAVAQDTGSLAGEARDITGAGVAVRATLQQENTNGVNFRFDSDGLSPFRFSNLPPGSYSLELQVPGFQTLRVRSIQIGVGEHRVLPPLELTVGSMADCGGHAVLDYIRFLVNTDGRTGDLRGAVKESGGLLVSQDLPVAHAKVKLLCKDSAPCRETWTDEEGIFVFNKVPPADFSIRVEHPSYYPVTEPEFKTKEGRQLTYFPIYVEHCATGNCDPKLRPPKPPRLCM